MVGSGTAVAQEGAHFGHASQSRIVGLTGKALRSKSSLPPQLGVSGPEENRIEDSVTSVEAYKPSDLAALSLITTHTYNGAPGSRQAISKLASRHQKRLWASEYGDGDTSGVTLAARITTDLNEMNISVWTLWQTADLDNSLTTRSGWGLTATSFCGCTNGRSCVCKPEPAGCKALKDTWAPSWSHDPTVACGQWSTNSDWGALKGGQTIKQACASSFGRDSCAKTCCELVGPDHDAATTLPPAVSVAAEGTHGAFAIRKNFYAYKQFTAFIRPGSTIVQPPDAGHNRSGIEPLLLTAINPSGHAVMVLTNEHPTDSVIVNHTLSGLRATSLVDGWCAMTHRTSREHDCAQLANDDDSGATVSLLPTPHGDRSSSSSVAVDAMLPPRSITTIVVSPCGAA